MSKTLKPNTAHAFLQGSALAKFAFANVSRNQVVTALYGDALGFEFDPAESEALAVMFETMAGLIRGTPAALERAITDGKLPESALTDAPVRKPDPNAN